MGLLARVEGDVDKHTSDISSEKPDDVTSHITIDNRTVTENGSVRVRSLNVLDGKFLRNHIPDQDVFRIVGSGVGGIDLISIGLGIPNNHHFWSRLTDSYISTLSQSSGDKSQSQKEKHLLRETSEEKREKKKGEEREEKKRKKKNEKRANANFLDFVNAPGTSPRWLKEVREGLKAVDEKTSI